MCTKVELCLEEKVEKFSTSHGKKRNGCMRSGIKHIITSGLQSRSRLQDKTHTAHSLQARGGCGFLFGLLLLLVRGTFHRSCTLLRFEAGTFSKRTATSGGRCRAGLASQVGR